MTDYSQMSDPVERQLCKLNDICRATNAHNAEQARQAIQDRFLRLRTILDQYRDKGSCIPWGTLHFSAPYLENYTLDWYLRMPVSCIFYAESGRTTELYMAQLSATILNVSKLGISSLFWVAEEDKPRKLYFLPESLPANSRTYSNADDAYPVIQQANVPSIILIPEADRLLSQQRWRDLLRTCLSRKCFIMIGLKKNTIPVLPENSQALSFSFLHECPKYLRQQQQAYPELCLEWKHKPTTKEQLQGLLRQLRLPPTSSATEPSKPSPISEGGDGNAPKTFTEQHIQQQPKTSVRPSLRRRRDIPFD